MAVLAVFAAALLMAFTLFGSERTPDAVEPLVSAVDGEQPPEPTAADPDPGAGDATTRQPPVAPPEAAINRDAELAVLNGTRTSGLARRATEELRELGWTVVSTDNYRDGDPEAPTSVYYRGADLRSTAEAVAIDLASSVVVQSQDFPADITVVLGPDYAGR